MRTAIERSPIAYDPEVAFSSRNGHIHPTIVVQKTDAPACGSSYTGDDDYVFFSALKCVNSVHFDNVFPARLAGCQFANVRLEELSKIVHLLLVRTNHTYAALKLLHCLTVRGKVHRVSDNTKRLEKQLPYEDAFLRVTLALLARRVLDFFAERQVKKGQHSCS